MIETITMSGYASFGVEPQIITGLSLFNYFYGSNGTGKSSISRVIGDAAKCAPCNVTWSLGSALETLVYNQDFVNKNFAELKGIFTLGEKSVEARKQIDVKKAAVDEDLAKIEQLTNTLQGADGSGGKKAELGQVESACRDKCWRQKQKHDEKFKEAFKGYRDSQENFKANVLRERTVNKAQLKTLADLEERAAAIFGANPVSEATIAEPTAGDFTALESHPIFNKRIIGSTDVDIAAMIQKLGNSDWVKEGVAYYSVNDNICPFCQQRTPESLSRSLNEYFDETFESDKKSIDDVEVSYTASVERLDKQLKAIIAALSSFLDVERLKSEKALFDSKTALNLQMIATKKKEPSRSIELDVTDGARAAIGALVKEANERIEANNRTVANLSRERQDLTEQIWKYVCEDELKNDLLDYDRDKENLEKAIAALSKQIEDKQTEKRGKEAEIRALEKQITSIQPTVDAINSVLLSFGFSGFTLAGAGNGKSYSIVRSDGKDAKNTLSEGEKGFVAFLYFYQLVKGSISESGMTTDRVVVFDDPVSSFDTDVLFVVSSLIREVVREAKAGQSPIRQVFVLTHNPYFHKEVTFKGKASTIGSKDETFWTVKKMGSESRVERHQSNPVKTVYEMLWEEVRNPNRATIQNALRRILEHYFKILGGIDPDEVCKQSTGPDRLICNSLLSWVNAGSHSAFDDMTTSLDDSTVETYLRVFKAIFEKSGHASHYDLMMRSSPTDMSSGMAGTSPAEPGSVAVTTT